MNSSTVHSSDQAEWSLIEAFLTKQQEMSAVEEFAQWHEAEAPSEQAEHYQKLIPLSAPKPGEQYAFEVDLDACSGCKACVTACHNLNGLEEEELWRDVGLLQGGDTEFPVIQHVTTACHHCLEPACLHGCPVNAYEKDLRTGIVRHLDDQCIGCQYCIFKCPYDVPRYSKQKGIVRKCDMCHQRLAVGEAPACVQACPNSAIRITNVKKERVIAESEANLFLAGAPEPQYTLPTTIYRSERALPKNLLPADHFTIKTQHAHWPLIWMLVFTQLSVGVVLLDCVFNACWPLAASIRWSALSAGLLFGIAGILSSTLHLGRPWWAFRALLGIRTSWLSREILAFGLFGAAAFVHWLLLSGLPGAAWLSLIAGLGAGLSGVAGVFCSAMIYIDTRRPFWNAPATFCKFILTTMVLGTAVTVTALGFSGSEDQGSLMQLRGLLWILSAAAIGKLLADSIVLRHLRDIQHTPQKRAAILLRGALWSAVKWRWICGVVGGILLPALYGTVLALQSSSLDHLFLMVVALGIALMLLIGEILERYTFFAAAVAPKMPGAPLS